MTALHFYKKLHSRCGSPPASAELSLEPGAEAGHSGVDGRHPGLPAPRVTKGGHPHEDTDPGLGDEAAPGVALTPVPTSAMQPRAQVSR